MMTYAERRQAYMDGCINENELVGALFMDAPSDTPAIVRGMMQEMVNTIGINMATRDNLADLVVLTPA